MSKGPATRNTRTNLNKYHHLLHQTPYTPAHVSEKECSQFKKYNEKYSGIKIYLHICLE